MVRIELTEAFYAEVEKTFKKDAVKIFSLIETLYENPLKGKSLGMVGSLQIRELRYRNYRFYFVADGHSLKLYAQGELVDVLLRFVRMSNKKYQQQTINEIRAVLLQVDDALK